MSGDFFEILTAKQRARVEIDAQLKACGWTVQDYQHAAVREAQGVAVREMPTGSGKTFTAANAVYRLLRCAGAGRVLFLVDRANLGHQAVRKFQWFETPDDRRKFTELYNVRFLEPRAQPARAILARPAVAGLPGQQARAIHFAT